MPGVPKLDGYYKELSWLRIKLDHGSCLYGGSSTPKKTWRITLFHLCF